MTFHSISRQWGRTLGATLFLLSLLFLWTPARAQTPVDNQLLIAVNVLKGMYPDCATNKYVPPCISNLNKDGYGVKGTLTQDVNGSTVSTDINVSGKVTAADAQFAFNIGSKSEGTFPAQTTPVPQFWRTETFEATPGQKGSGVLSADLGNDPTSPNGGASGVLICGNLTVDFKLLFFAKLGGAGDKALVDATQGQLKSVMTQVAQALSGSGACNGSSTPTSPGSPAPPPVLATITNMDRVSVRIRRAKTVEWQKAGTGTDLHFDDELCFKGAGKLELNWLNEKVTLSDGHAALSRLVNGELENCFQITIVRPEDTPGVIKSAGRSLVNFVAGVPHFVSVVVEVLKPPKQEESDFKFQASSHTIIAAEKGTTYIIGDDSPHSSIICLIDGALDVVPRNPSLQSFNLPAGNQVRVTEEAVGAITPGCTLPDDTTVPQPDTDVSGMTLQAAQRYVVANDTVLVPVWLIKGQNLVNLNFQIGYDPAVIQPAGDIAKGNLLDNTLFKANATQSGNVLVGLAQTNALSGTGTVLNIPFKAVGKPGDVSPLLLDVTTINDPNGGILPISLIAGQITIVNPDGTLPPVDGGTNGGSNGGSNGGTGTGANGGAGNGGNGGIQQGDCDGDGHLTELDALCALEMSTAIRTPRLFLDMDGDGSVTSRDAVILLQRVVSK